MLCMPRVGTQCYGQIHCGIGHLQGLCCMQITITCMKAEPPLFTEHNIVLFDLPVRSSVAQNMLAYSLDTSRPIFTNLHDLLLRAYVSTQCDHPIPG